MHPGIDARMRNFINQSDDHGTAVMRWRNKGCTGILLRSYPQYVSYILALCTSQVSVFSTSPKREPKKIYIQKLMETLCSLTKSCIPSEDNHTTMGFKLCTGQLIA